MSPAGVPLIICAVIAAVFLAVSLRLRRKQRLLADLPTSKAEGVFIGLVELCGTAETAEPLVSFLRGAPCVHYSYEVQEHWSRTVVETYTDKDGKSQTRTRHESGWTTVAKGGESQPFYLQDDTGVVLVRPRGAKLEPSVIFDETVDRGHPLYFEKGPSHAVHDSDHRRRFVEHAVTVRAPLYIVGQARERADVVAAEIAEAKDAPLFLISTRTEKNVQRRHAAWSWVCWFLGALVCVAGTLFVANEAQPVSQGGRIALAVGPVATYFVAWGIAWTWMVFNSLIGLRQRVRQAWSLIDVQLKRRHDLIPNLATIVTALGSHEKIVQTAVAALRAQLAATPPGKPGPDPEGVVTQLRTIIERYPDLVAQPAFSRLHEELVRTEQRIALARAYYNDIATQFATRLERVPDRWVGAIVSMRPEPLLSAAHFERARVSVELQPSTTG